MQMIKRLVVWLIETLSEALLLGTVLIALLGYDQKAFFKDLSVYSSGVVLLFFTTGYILTTAVVRAVWSGRALWLYPTVATGLFLIHFEIMNVLLRGAFAPSDRLRIRAAGACIVILCTIAGTLALRKWVPTQRDLADAPGG
jgi:hypothetical protein